MNSSLASTLPTELLERLAKKSGQSKEQIRLWDNNAITWSICDDFDIAVLNISRDSINVDLYFRFRAIWHENLCIPLFSGDVVVMAACAKPWDLALKRSLTTKLQRDIRLVGAEESSIEAVLAILHGTPAPIEKKNRTGLLQSLSEGQIEFHPETIIDSFRKLTLQVRSLGASDIHVTPYGDRVSIRARFRGNMETLPPLSPTIRRELIDTLKAYCGIPTHEPDIFHDGRATIDLENEDPIELRAVSCPTAYGEAFVFRILDPNKLKPLIGTLPFSGRPAEIFKSHLSRGQGLIWVTGPTGSGKTTTLYRALTCIDLDSNSVQTLEQPIEYRIDRISQYEIKAGMTFAQNVRYLMRSDPDVLLVGETRDSDTAKSVYEFALTGHLVFSTLHVTSALESFPRLRDLGVPLDVMAAGTSLIIAQRLVASLCRSCKRTVPIPADAASHISARLGPQNVPSHLCESRGCKDCFYTGIGGVLAIFELVEIDDELKRLIRDGADMEAMNKAWEKAGGEPLIVNGLRLVASGDVPYSEVAIYENNRSLMRVKSLSADLAPH